MPDGGAFTLIDESYNASPVAVRAAITVLGHRKTEGGGRKIIVLGDMKELGDSAPALHASLAADIVVAGIDCVFCCGALMQNLYDALPIALRGAMTSDSTALAPHIINALRANDIVTVKGSHSMNMDKIIAHLKAH